MPHGLTILTATMTGGMVGAPAAATTTGCCCPCCPAWCAAYCPAWCTTTAPAAVPVVVAPHAAGTAAAVPGAYAPAAAAAAGGGGLSGGLSALPGGWGNAGGPLPPLSYPPPGAAPGVYSGGTPALTGAMTLFTTGRDRAGQLLKQLRETALTWGSDEPSAAGVAPTEVAAEMEENEEAKTNSMWRRGSMSITTACSSDRQDSAPRLGGRTVKRSDCGSRSCRSEESSTESVIFCGVAVEEVQNSRRGSQVSVFL